MIAEGPHGVLMAMSESIATPIAIARFHSQKVGWLVRCRFGRIWPVPAHVHKMLKPADGLTNSCTVKSKQEARALLTESLAIFPTHRAGAAA